MFFRNVSAYCVLEDEVVCVCFGSLSFHCPMYSLLLVVFCLFVFGLQRVFSIFSSVSRWSLIQQWVCILRSINEKVVSDAGRGGGGFPFSCFPQVFGGRLQAP